MQLGLTATPKRKDNVDTYAYFGDPVARNHGATGAWLDRRTRVAAATTRCAPSGGEELYDRSQDEMEWTNLAAKPELAPVKRDLAKWMPQVNAPESLRERGVEEID